MYEHGHADRRRGRSPTYFSWLAMKNRCNNPNCHAYDRYGGRGIKHDPRWHRFENFLTDMGERPAGTTLDRIDSDKHYVKENCRWLEKAKQNKNRRWGEEARAQVC